MLKTKEVATSTAEAATSLLAKVFPATHGDPSQLNSPVVFD